jgi:hypothetical protein
VKQDGVTQDVNTVISSVTFDLQGTSTQVQTAFSELDLIGVVT